jgi:hypothetical protein
MDVSKLLIAMGVSVALGAGTLGAAVAQTGDKEDSVHSWGRWAVLSPAAGGEEYVAFAPKGTDDLKRCEAAANCPSPKPPKPEPPVAEGPCAAGAPCGFTYIDTLVRGEGQGEESHVGKFELTLSEGENENGKGKEGGFEPSALAESQGVNSLTVAFRVNPGEADEIQSDVLPALATDTGFRSDDRTSLSLVNGRVTAVSDDEEPAIIEGFWRQNVEDGSYQQNGEYIVGVAATAEEMSQLLDQLGDGIRGDVIGFCEGPTGRGGNVALSMNFDRATWEGDFAGQAVDFGASGAIVGSGFVSDPGGFSDNIATGLVEGGFVNAGQNAIGAFEVTDLEGLHDADIFNAELRTQIED